jgi:hypothetical protein
MRRSLGLWHGPVMNEMWGAISLSIEIILLVEPLCSPVVSIAMAFVIPCHYNLHRYRLSSNTFN